MVRGQDDLGGMKAKIDKYIQDSIDRAASDIGARVADAVKNAPMNNIVTERVIEMQKDVPGVMITTELRAKRVRLFDVEINTDDWMEIAQLDGVAMWALRNAGDIDIEYAFRNNETAPNVILPDAERYYDTQPEKLWARRVNDSSSPTLHVEIWDW